MKYLNKIYALAFCAVAAMSFTACDDDTEFSKLVTGDSENRVFTNVLYAAGHPGAANLQNSVGFSVTQTPVSSILNGANEMQFELPISCIKPAEKDILVNVNLGTSVPSGFKAFPANVSFSSTSSTIKAGQTEGETILVTVDASEFAKFAATDVPYCQPITIQSGDETISENMGTAYLVVTADFSAVMKKTNGVESGRSKIAGSSWAVTLNGATTDSRRTNVKNALTDNSTSTYVTFPGNGTIDIDLGQEVGVASIGGTWASWYYACVNMTVSVSKDGVTYTELGKVSKAQGDTAIWLNLYGNENARYIRVVFDTYQYSSGYAPRLRELMVYTIQ
ncbi:MAG: discoidin domain-containing protein [Bacteroidales bacterium]|nr:discoidin domain-containing protein [Bacteroidales bacterium]